MFEDVLRFWLDRGVDGFRVDVAHGLFKEASLRDQVVEEGERRASSARSTPSTRWSSGTSRTSRCGTSPRCTTSTAAGTRPRRVRRPGPDGRRRGLDPDPGVDGRLRPPPTSSTRPSTSPGCWPTGRPSPSPRSSPTRSPRSPRRRLADVGAQQPRRRTPPDPLRRRRAGLARARAATLAMLALPGSAYLYQGEELGLEQVDVLPRTGRTRPGSAPARSAATAAGCRCPGAATRRRTPSGPAASSPGSRSRTTGRASPSRPRPATRLDAGVLPRGAGRRREFACRGRRGRDRSTWRPDVLAFSAATSRGRAQLRHRRPSRSPTAMWQQRSGRLTPTAVCSADTATVGCGRRMRRERPAVVLEGGCCSRRASVATPRPGRRGRRDQSPSRSSAEQLARRRRRRRRPSAAPPSSLRTERGAAVLGVGRALDQPEVHQVLDLAADRALVHVEGVGEMPTPASGRLAR